MTTIGDIFDIPTQVHQGDFVLQSKFHGPPPSTNSWQRSLPFAPSGQARQRPELMRRSPDARHQRL